jgi:hypothetical protein
VKTKPTIDAESSAFRPVVTVSDTCSVARSPDRPEREGDEQVVGKEVQRRGVHRAALAGTHVGRRTNVGLIVDTATDLDAAAIRSAFGA